MVRADRLKAGLKTLSARAGRNTRASMAQLKSRFPVRPISNVYWGEAPVFSRYSVERWRAK